MKTINDLNSIMEKINNHYHTLLSSYHDEVKEEGIPKENTVILFNSLMCSINKAYEVLDKGMDGEF